jgi:carbon monoxide dehydrogenase subunit G
MPYEATVPVHRRLLWPAVADPERLLGALPNAVIDAAGSQGVAGRLKLRVRDQSVTFRGVARIVEVVPATLRICLEIEAAFGRADGSVQGVVEIVLQQAGSGTRVVVSSQVEVVGAAPVFPPQALDAALDRLVQRWFAALAASSPSGGAERAVAAAEGPSRPPERGAPLAVVRDLPADSPAGSGPDDEVGEMGAGSRVSAGREAGPATLRLISPEPAEQSAPEPLAPEPPPDDALEASPEADDLWSRTRERAVPQWAGVLLGVFAVATGAMTLIVAVLRRRRHR